MSHTRKAGAIARSKARIAVVLCFALVLAMVPAAAFAGPAGDTAAPITTTNAVASYNNTAAISISATDSATAPVTGVAWTKYTLDGSAPTTITANPTAYALPAVNTAGNHTLTYWSADNDGNVEAVNTTTFTVNDTAKPITVSDREASYLDSGTISLTATDTNPMTGYIGSGVDKTYYSLDGGPATAGTTFGFSGFGMHTVSFWSVDKAGNTETAVTTSFMVDDGTAPVTTSDAKSIYYDSKCTITLTPSDGNGSGVYSTQYSLDGADDVQGTVVTCNAVGDHTLTFYSTDNALNTEVSKTVTFTVSASPVPGSDALAPVSTSDAKAAYASSPASIDVTSTDEVGGSGMATLYYRIDGGATQSATKAASVKSIHAMVSTNLPITPTTVAPDGHFASGTPSTNAACAGCHFVGPAPAIDAGVATPTGHTSLACTTCHTINVPPTPVGDTLSAKITVTGDGVHTLEFWGVDKAGNVETPHKTVSFVIGSTTPGSLSSRVYGSDRYGTALKVSQKNFSTADTVIVATGLSYPDALSAAGLAGVYHAPLLLTAPASLTSGVATEITRLGATKVVVVGGTSAVSEAVKTQIASATGATVTRVAGADRYATSAEVAKRIVAELGTGFSGSAFLVRGDQFADALAASPLAYNANVPILLTASTSLSPATEAAIKTLGIDDVAIIGSTNAVSKSVADAVTALPGTPAVTRVAGADRYATAHAVAEFGLDNGLCTTGFIGVATGADFPDALGGGIAAGEHGGVLLMTAPDALSSVWTRFLTDECAPTTMTQVFGGSNAVSNAVKVQIDTLLYPGL